MPLTLQQLERHLFKAADILHGKPFGQQPAAQLQWHRHAPKNTPQIVQQAVGQ